MADKKQLGLANGSPPQFTSSNATMQPNFASQSQANIRCPLGVDHSSYSNQYQKPPITLVNGQVPLTSKNLNQLKESNHLINNYSIGAGDSQQPSVVTHVPHSTQTARPNTNLLGSNLKLSQNIHSPLNHQNLAVSMVGQNFPHQQMLPNLNSVQNVIKPSPVLENKQDITTSGAVQQSGVSQTQLPQPTHTFTAQNSSISTPLIPTVSSQSNKPPYGPSTSTNLIPKSSPNSQNMALNQSYSSYMVPPLNSHDIKPSPLHHYPAEGSQPKQSHHLTNSQSFLPITSQSVAMHGIPHGYQPLSIGTNPVAQKLALPSAPFSSDKQQHGSSSAFGTPTNQNQLQTNKNLGPPLLPPQMDRAPPPQSVPLQHNSLHSLPTTGNSYGNLKQSEIASLSHRIGRISVTQQGFNKLWGMETVDLLQCRNILPPRKVTPPPIRLQQEFMDNVNCSPEIFRCTLNKIPETNSLLQKSRLPLGILIHPFRDLKQLAVIQCSSIVRCRACRTYINPFVYFVDNKRWKCNLCFRVNELPDEFQYDPVSKTYGDPSRRPEIRSSTIEFIAPSEYMLRPPQPAIYLFVLDVSRWGCDSGYLETLCSVLLEELDNIPGDSRTQIGFILFDSTIHFFSIAESYNQAHEMIVTDIDDVFLPTPDTLLVNLNENRQLIKDLLQEIPKKYAESFDTDSALGSALQAAYKLMSPTGGRITIFQSCLPNKGPGSLSPREDPNQRSSRDVRHLGPQTDFYKRLSLDCSTQQISVDIFLVSSQYSDLATLGEFADFGLSAIACCSGVSQFSGGCIYHFPLFRRMNSESNERLARALRRYLTRKIGFEAVMRVRCSRGLSIHTFHGNLFVRSTDLLSLPNVNPDAGFGMQIAIEDSLFELQTVCFQAAVLYTSAKGERRIRVHTLCLPVSSNLSDILTSADQQAVVGLLGKMAVDRSLKSTLLDAREAFMNVAIDILSAYKLVETSGGQNTILAPVNLSLIPLYILALLKSTAFRTGQSTRLDDRVYAMSQMKTLPLRELIQLIHPDFYHVTHLEDDTGVEFEDKSVAQPARLSLSSEHLDSRGAFLLDTPEVIYLLIGKNISSEFLVNIFDVTDVRQINKDLVDLPELENDESEKLRHFINFLQAEKPWPAVMKIVTEPSVLVPFLINDKAENALSYYELLHHVKAQLK